MRNFLIGLCVLMNVIIESRYSHESLACGVGYISDNATPADVGNHIIAFLCLITALILFEGRKKPVSIT